MKVLSLFDGMSCGRIALDQLGIPVEKYYASEVDKYAMQVSAANYPDIEQVGDICDLDPKDYKDVDLMLAGSPCQGFSFAGKQLAFDDPRSALFFEFIRLLKAIKPKYFLLENVRMKKEFLQVISEQVSACYPKIVFGIEPIFINSSLVSAQSRQRYYWTNIPRIKQPEDRGIVLRDILEDDVEEPMYSNIYGGFKEKKPRIHVGKSVTIRAACGGGHIPSITLKTRPKQVGGGHREPKVLVSKKKIIEQLKKENSRVKGMSINKDGIRPHRGDKRKSGLSEMGRILFKDAEKTPTITATHSPKVVTGGRIVGRAYDKDGKRMDKDGVSVANKTTQMLELRKDNKTNAITTVGKDSVVVEKSHPIKANYYKSSRANFENDTSKGGKFSATGVQQEDLTWRKLTPLECERLQTVPDNYTNHVSNTQRYKMLGNGWTVEVIKHIFQNMERE